jgi:hypothetical protein
MGARVGLPGVKNCFSAAPGEDVPTGLLNELSKSTNNGPKWTLKVKR